jgi:hypothetical protein
MSVKNETQWVHKNLPELVQKYGGKWVIVLNQKVVFADIAFDVVLHYGLKKLKGQNYVLEWIDSGDAIIYAFKVSNEIFSRTNRF